jgi:hypothetical protein
MAVLQPVDPVHVRALTQFLEPVHVSAFGQFPQPVHPAVQLVQSAPPVHWQLYSVHKHITTTAIINQFFVKVHILNDSFLYYCYLSCCLLRSTANFSATLYYITYSITLFTQH